MSSFKAIREEDDDSGFSRQVTLKWTIPHFLNVLARVKPKQRLKSPPFRIFNCSGFDVEGSIIFFPRGASGTESKNPQPTLGVELMHGARDPDPSVPRSQKLNKQKKRRPTPIAIEVELFTDGDYVSESLVSTRPTQAENDDSEDPQRVSISGCTEMEIMKRPVIPRWMRQRSGVEASNDMDDDGGDEEGDLRPDEPMKSTPEDTIEVIGAVTSDQFDRVHQFLTIVMKITFLSHADDLSDVSESDSDTHDENKPPHKRVGLDRLFHASPFGQRSSGSSEASALLSQVINKGQGLFGNLLAAQPTDDVESATVSNGDAAPVGGTSTAESGSVMKSAAAAASAVVAGAAAELFHRHQADIDYSPEWQPLVEVYCSSEGEPPNRWRSLGSGIWSVFAHCLCDLDATFVRGATSEWLAATSVWSRPSPAAVTAVFEWCPPVRQRLTELVPHQTNYKNFWISFFSTIDRVTRFDPRTESQNLLSELISIVGSGGETTVDAESDASSARTLSDLPHSDRNKIVNAMQLLNFALQSDDLEVIDVPSSVLTKDEVEQQLELVRSVASVLEKKQHHGFDEFNAMQQISSVHGEGCVLELRRTVEQLRATHDTWKQAERRSVSDHHAVVEKVRGICEHGAWSLIARRTLAAAGERGTAGISEICDTIALVVEAADGLLAASV